MDPERMRAAVADYVTALHRAYLAQADTFPPAVRGAMPLLTGGPLQIAAVGARNLHLLATREGLGPLRGQEVAVEGSLPGLDWTLRFYDPVVAPALGLISEDAGPAYAEVRGALGVTTVVYHVVAQPGSGLTPHHAGHIGGKLQLDSLTLKIPIIGDLLRKVAVARFCRTLGTLTASGVPILEGMDITARTAGNQVVANAILKAKDAVEAGRNISAPLAETKVFPPMVTQMVGVGEATGALDAMLNKVADFYEDEVDNAVAGLTSLMEPIIIAILGGVIGFIVIAMYLPIFNLANVFSKTDA